MTANLGLAPTLLRSLRSQRLAPIALLLGTTILGSNPALAQTLCTVDTARQTCRGNQGAGILLDGTTPTLVVEDLTARIAPTAGTAGISYRTETGAVLLVDTGDFGIATVGADGINVLALGGNVYITQTGSISASGGGGVVATAHNGGIVIEGTGNITSSAEAVLTDPHGGASTLNWIGDLTSTEGRAVVLGSETAGVTLTGAGAIRAKTDAVVLEARGPGGGSSLDWTGDISSETGRAVVLLSHNGRSSVVGSGTISAKLNAVTLTTRNANADASFNWSGTISSNLGTAVTLLSEDAGASVKGSGSVSGVHGFTVEARGGSGNASVAWDGTITAGAGKGISAYAANGAADVSGSGTISAGGTGILVKTDGNDDDASLKWRGEITSREGIAARVETAGGDANLSGAGVVSGALGGLFAVASGGDARLVWDGEVSTVTGAGVVATSDSGEASVIASGVIDAADDGITVRTYGNRAATVDWTGEVRSRLNHAIVVTSATGAASVIGTGTATGAKRGVHAASTGYETTSVNWDGTVIGGTEGIYAYSSLGAASVVGTGLVEGGTVAIHLETEGSATSSLDWTGDLVSTGSNAVHIRSALGAVASNTRGTITSTGGGIYAENGSDIAGRTVSVSHQGSLTASGVGIEARSPGANIAVEVTGDMATGSYGIYAQGLRDATVSVEHTGDIYAGFAAIYAYSAVGTVSVEQHGDITMYGSGDGIIAINEGTGVASVIKSGTMTAGGDGIYVKSIVGTAVINLTGATINAGKNGLHLSGWGNLHATISAGSEVVGSDGYAGVFFDNGTVNTLTNHGIIRNAGGIDDYAISSAVSDTYVETFGTIRGNVLLGPWSNSFDIRAGGLVESGTVLNVGEGNTVSVAGTLSPGGAGMIHATELTGNLSSTATGRLAFDIDMDGAAADTLAVSGTAALGGTLALQFSSVDRTSISFDILTAEGGITSQNLDLSNPFLTTHLETLGDGKTLRVSLSDLSFAPEGLSQSGQQVGSYFNRAFEDGGPALRELAALIASSGSVQSADEIYEQLSPSIVLDTLTSTYLQAHSFSDGMMSCPNASGLMVPVREGSCDWTRLDYSALSRGDAESTVVGMTYGWQRALEGSDWRVGAALGLTFASTSTKNGSTTNTERLNAGVTLKYAPGPFQLSAALSGTWGDMSSLRTVTLGDETQVLSGDSRVGGYNLKLRGAYVFGSDSLYLMPQVDLNTTYLTSSRMTETGGIAALSVDAMSDVVFGLSPAVEIGKTHRGENGSVLRAFARVGTSFYSKAGVNLTSRLAEDESGAEGFKLSTGGDKQVWNVSAGISAFEVKGWTGEAKINLTLGDDTFDRQASLKVRKSF